MSAQEEIFQSDESAASDSSAENDAGYSVNVTGEKTGGKISGKAEGGKPKKKFGAAVVITGFLVIIMFLMLAVPSFAMDHIATTTIEQTDQQYADWMQSNALVLQQSMLKGYLPSNTDTRFEDEGVIVGYMENGVFVEGRESPERKIPLCLKMDDEIIEAKDFYYEFNHNVKLHGIINKVTYGRAGAYYDPAAEEVFKDISSRNNLSADKTLDETMDEMMGSGNDIHNDDKSWYYQRTCSTVEEKDEENGTTTTKIVCSDWRDVKDEDSAKKTSANAEQYISNTVMYNMSTSQNQAIYNTVDSLKDADTISKERRSMLLYAGFAESFSKVKAGYGYNKSDTDLVLSAISSTGSVYGGSNVNEVMNRMFETETVTIIDVETGQPKDVKGSMLEAPSLYAVLSGEKPDMDEVANYSSDRVLKTVEKQLGVSNIGSTMETTIVSTNNKASGTISRYTVGGEGEGTSYDITPIGTSLTQLKESAPEGLEEIRNEGLYDEKIGVVTNTLQSSMYDNSFDNTVGIPAGELFIEGAVNIGKKLAQRGGGAPGDQDAVEAYMKLTSDVIAMDNAADRLNRSPFDITSKNTFLGSIVYKLGVASIKSGSILNKMSTLSRTAMSSIASLMPVAKADEENGNNMYLSNYGNCETIGNTYASGSPQCVEVDVFDTTTYGGEYGMIYSDKSFMEWKSKNLDCEDDDCKVIENSELAEYLTFNTNSVTPLGMMDGGALEAIPDSSCNETKGFFSKIITYVRNLLNISKMAANNELTECQKSFASGARFVKSSKNIDENGNSNWEKYKYAQRYIQLDRVAEARRMYDDDETAYIFDGFGKTSAVAKYLDKLNQDTIAVND